MASFHRVMVMLVVVGTVFQVTLAATLSSSPFNQEVDDIEESKRQAENAHYKFSSDIDDKINDLSVHRQETRDGLSVKGSYSYSDGYLRRTVNYVADENGYRIISEEVEPLPGPNVDNRGIASIRSEHDGTLIHYRIQGVPSEESEN